MTSQLLPGKGGASAEASQGLGTTAISLPCRCGSAPQAGANQHDRTPIFGSSAPESLGFLRRASGRDLALGGPWRSDFLSYLYHPTQAAWSPTTRCLRS